ncbi:porin [Burkholderia multivorans]|uniref:porin n=1 Tax=Burkholderia multivorans TaxID=87883 RepID=UPI001C21E50F|nr:porin [Burkholderia multivorans]MBU9477690.1 porin [Burkholderia multivorans]
MFKRSLVAGVTLAVVSMSAYAQSSITLYGILDEYVGYMHTSNGKSLTALNDGALTRSRWGMRGVEDIGGGNKIIFQLENGFNATNGALNDSSRLFDRQAWIGVDTQVGTFKVGRQIATAFANGGAYDYTAAASYGSVVEVFGMPTRFDNDISYLSPRIANFQVELHYAMPGIPGGGLASQAIYQWALDYTNGPFRAGYTGLIAKPAPTGPIQTKIQYHNLHAWYDYGRGRVYFTYVRSNNSTGSEATSNNALGILSNVAVPNNFFAGTNPDAERFYNVYQVSADFRISPAFRVGALVGKIQDTKNGKNDAYGANIGGFYNISKRTLLYAFANYLKNEGTAGFRFSGSGAPVNFTGPDVNGKGLIGIQAGIQHLF